MIFLLLCLEFAKIGLFSFGGGYATLPFLYHMSEVYNWFSLNELSQMLAISSITPGPVGLNVATFAGFKTAGVLGSLCATMSIMLPSFVFVVIVSKMLKKFKDSPVLNSVMYVLRPVAAALLASVAFRLFFESVVKFNTFSDFALKNIDCKALLLFIILLLVSLKVKKDPLLYLAFGAIAGILLHFGHIFTY